MARGSTRTRGAPATGSSRNDSHYYVRVHNTETSIDSVAPGRPRRLLLAVAAAVILSTALLGCSNDKKPATSSSSSGPSAVDQLLDEGVKAQADGHLDVARDKYLQVLQMDSTNKIAHYDLGVIYQLLDDSNNARDEYNKAITIDATYQPALFNLAILETSSNPGRAEELYRSLLQINANDANVHFNLGLLLKQIGRVDEGNTEVATAVQIDPSLASRVPAESTASSESTSSSAN
jgi:Tfp pilus assembly protein PilF